MGASILVVEDYPANLEFARYLLSALHYEVLTASTGRQGLALAQEHRPDLIVSDLEMPEMNGYELIAALRADPHCADIPALALTAFSMPADRQRVLDAGFDDYATKPIEPEAFGACVAALLVRGRGPAG